MGSFSDPMFLRTFSNFRLLSLLVVRSHQEEIIIVKGLIQGRNVTRCGLNRDHLVRVVVETTLFSHAKVFGENAFNGFDNLAKSNAN